MMNVLLADDERLERIFLRRILDQYSGSYRVVAEAANGRQALDQAVLQKPDIAILDINMPEVNGLEAGRRLKSMNPDIIVVLNSAYAEFQFAQKALEYRLDAYLVKPSTERDIMATLESLTRPCTETRNRSPEVRGLAGETRRDAAFPHATLEALLQGMARKDLGAVTAAARRLESELAERSDDPVFRLFAINLVFSVDRTLQTGGVPGELLRLLDSGAALQTLGDTGTDGDMRGAVSEYLSRLILLLEGLLHTGRTRDQILHSMTAYVDANFHKDIHLEDLANLVFLSQGYASRLFHSGTGMTLARYVHQKRAALARDLLSNSDLTIKEISHQCGYRSISHFYRTFESVTGHNPGFYRREEL